MECNKTFEDMKRHLASLPLLASPRLGEELFLYFTTFDEVVSAVLVCERSQELIQLYYISQRLQGLNLCSLSICTYYSLDFSRDSKSSCDL